MNEFKSGDVVRLKSDDIKMTVQGTKADGKTIECVWHDKNGTHFVSNFASNTLILCEGYK